jgi:hypothetical protein
MIAVGYYGIIDLVDKRGVILQHEIPTSCQKGSKDGRIGKGGSRKQKYCSVE